MVKLNLPSFDYKLLREGEKVFIFDGIRKKQVVLTAEEWVRQHFVNYLVNHKNYPRSLIRVEGGLSYNNLSRRSDIVVHNRQGNPWMIVECKSPRVKLNRKTIEQASVYNSQLKAEYLVVTNGLDHYIFWIDWVLNKTRQLDSFPDFSETDINRE